MKLNGTRQLLVNAVNYVNAIPDGKGHEQFTSNSWKTDVSDFTLNTSAFRSVEGIDHTMFVLDIDIYPEDSARVALTNTKLRKLQLKAVLATMQTILDRDPNFFCYLSGKGGYMIRKIYPNVSKANLYKKVWKIVGRCQKRHSTETYCEDWHDYKRGITRWMTVDDYKIEAVIDRHMIMKKGVHVFRMPYSAYTKIIPNIYICAPILFTRKEPTVIDIEASIKNTDLQYCKLVDYSVPHEKIDVLKTGSLLIDTKAITTSRKKEDQYVREYMTLNVPLPYEKLNLHQKNTVLSIKEKLTGNPEETPPCIKRAFTQNTPQHWNRVIIGRYLLHKGYTVEEIALFIRFAMNDEEDNSPDNYYELEKNMNIFVVPTSTNPRKPPGCNLLRDKTSQFYVATPADCLKCGRQYVTQDYKQTLRFQLEKDAEENQRIHKSLTAELKQNVGKYKTVVDRAKILITSNLPTVVKKTTRAGLTTSLVIASKRKKRRLLVLEPTNKIASKTFPEAVRIAKEIYDMDIRGAVLSSNPNGCLKIALQIREMHRKKDANPDWGDTGVQFHKLPLVLKPACNTTDAECEYFNSEFTFNSGEVIINSDTETLQCARISVLKNIEQYDTMFVTYSKLLASAKSDSDQSILTMYELSDFDIILLDEISSIIEGQPSVIPVAGYKNGKYYLKTDNIRGQLVQVAYDNSVSSNTLVNYVEECLQTIENGIKTITAIRGGKSTLIIENPLTQEQRDSVLDYYNIIQREVKKTNVDLSLLAQFYLALSEDEWYLTVITNKQNYTSINIVTKPELNIIRTFLRRMIDAGKLVLVTDASLPPTSLQFMNRLLNIKKWNTFDLGDPQDTNKQCLIIPDTKKVSITRIDRQKKLQFEAVRYAEMIIKQHGAKDVMLVLPNKKEFYKFLVKRFQRRYPALKITYYRSDMTVGVANNRRVMLAFCQPIPPSDSFNWLATHFAREDSIDMTTISNLLREHSAKQAFYQAIGRVKDPASTEFSVVYLYGIRAADAEKLLLEFHSPRILKRVDKKYDIRVMTGFYWRTSGMTVPSEIFKAVNYINKRGKVTLRSIQSIMKNDAFKFFMLNLSTFGIAYNEKNKKLISSVYQI